MSATTSASVHQLPRQRGPASTEPLAFRVFAWVVVVSDLTALALGVFGGRAFDRNGLVEFGAWALMVATVDLAPVSSGNGPRLDMDLPLLLAAAMIFGPTRSGLLALVASIDTREFRRQISPTKALYNRAQKSLSVMAAGFFFQVVGGEVGVWPGAVAAALLALFADIVTNYTLVSVAGGLLSGRASFSMVSRMKFGRLSVFVVTYTCFGFLGLLLAEIYLRLGVWGLSAFVIPVVLARQAFLSTHRLEEADEALLTRQRALRTISERIADERRDERLTVAAGLHDEVLPPIYKVHLMGQVLRQDLATGRLLALEDDLPELLEATERASDAMRHLIQELRRSSLGPGGLGETLRLLVRQFEQECDARIHLEVEEIGGSPLTQLLAYQVAREALYNAVRHAGASAIQVRLTCEESLLRVIIADDGRGFDPQEVDQDVHFGLLLIRERVELAGGVVQVQSVPGQGTVVVARLPMEGSPA